jgi:hypothetical protein
MTSMWKRGLQCQYPGTAIAAVRLSDSLVRPGHGRLSSTGSPP